jgi:hypothetical protein
LGACETASPDESACEALSFASAPLELEEELDPEDDELEPLLDGVDLELLLPEPGP